MLHDQVAIDSRRLLTPATVEITIGEITPPAAAAAANHAIVRIPAKSRRIEGRNRKAAKASTPAAAYEAVVAHG